MRERRKGSTENETYPGGILTGRKVTIVAAGLESFIALDERLRGIINELGDQEKFRIHHAPHRRELERMMRAYFPGLAQENVVLVERRDLRDPPRGNTDKRYRTSRNTWTRIRTSRS